MQPIHFAPLAPIVLAILTLGFGSVLAQEDEAAIETLDQQWADLYNQGDIEGVADLYTEDAIVYANTGEVIEGREAIRQALQSARQTAPGDVDREAAEEVEVFGDTAYSIGSYAVAGPDGRTLGRGNYLSILKKVGGSWKIHRQIDNADASLLTQGTSGGEASSGQGTDEGQEEADEALVRRFAEEVWTKGEQAAIDALVTPNFVDHGASSGRQGLEQLVETFHQGFPDLEHTVEDLVAEGDKVAERWTMRGTHQGEFMGIAPTGRQISVSGIQIYRIEDGRIAELWVSFDALGMLQQLGALPPVQSAPAADAQETLTQLERAWTEAYVQRDLELFERILADDWTMTTPDGTVHGKEQEIADVSSGALDYVSGRAEDIEVRVYGTAAVVTGRYVMEGSDNGRDISGQYRFTDTWVERNGAWQAVATQITRIAADR